MTSSTETGPARAAGIDRSIAARFSRLTRGFWRGDSARVAWFWTLALGLSLVGKLLIDVTVNTWNRWFFDALEQRNAAEAGGLALMFIGVLFCVAGVGAAIVRTRETLQVRWRQWVTAQLLERWLTDWTYLRLARMPRGLANPEYRISDDARLATEPVVDFAIGLFTALLAAATFVGILWGVGGALDVSIGGAQFEIPAFMVIGALIYGTITSTLVPLAGWRLPHATAARNEAEALFRAETIQLRENAESMALARAERFSRARLRRIYDSVAFHWLAMVRQHVNVTWVMNANSALIPVAPLIMALPKYLAGELSLGQVIQLASAFAQVQIAIGWLADNYRAVAEWFASARRVVELVDAFDAADADASTRRPRFDVTTDAGGALRINGLSLTAADGTIQAICDACRLARGDRASIVAENGATREILARALAGFWPWGAGEIAAPDGPVAFLGPSPFLPEGRLADAIACGAAGDALTDASIAQALRAVGARALADQVTQTDRWMTSLPATERQKCAIARAIAAPPAMIVIEDALSACDASTRSQLIRALFEHCPDTIIIDASHALAPRELYNRCLLIQPDRAGVARLVELDATPA